MRVSNLCGIIFLLGLIASTPPFNFAYAAQNESSSRGAAAYLYQGGGAKPQGMGNAYVGIANDPAAIYFNPSGLAFMNRPELGTMASSSINDERFWSMEYIQPLGRAGVIGVGAVGRQVEDILGRENEFDLPSVIDSREGTILLTYAKSWRNEWALGVNGKYLFQTFSGVSDNAKGYGVDLGLKYHPKNLSKFSFGTAIQNLGGNFNYSTGRNNPLLLLYKLGVACRPLSWLLTDVDLDIGDSQAAVLHAGAEARYGIALFRAGVNRQNPTIGFGIALPPSRPKLKFDFSLEFDTDGLGDQNRFGLGYVF